MSKNVEYEVEGDFYLEEVDESGVEVDESYATVKFGKKIPPDRVKLTHPCEWVRVEVKSQEIPGIESLRLKKGESIIFYLSSDNRAEIYLPDRFFKLFGELKSKKLKESLKKYLIGLGFSEIEFDTYT
jgi:hypothetical protein